MLRSELYADFLSRYDAQLCCAVATVRGAQSFEPISPYQSWKDEPDPATVQSFRVILPHLHAALRTRRELFELRAQINDFQNALHALGTGLVLLDAHGRSVFINAAAEKILSGADGLRMVAGRLRPAEPSELQRLEALVATAIETAAGRATQGGGRCTVSRPMGRPLGLSVQPLPPASRMREGVSRRRPAVMVLVEDPGAPVQGKPGLYTPARPQLRITPRQWEILERVVQGKSIKRIGTELGIAESTVKTHLTPILRALGATTRIEAIARIAELGLQVPRRRTWPD